MFARDETRIENVMSLMNTLPLGSAAMTGTSLKIDRKYVAKKLKLNLFRVWAESVQLPFILCWAKNRTEAIEWAKQQTADEWYEHESAPHFMENYNVEKVKNEDSLIKRDQKVPKAGP